jgi:hypothetical protein
MTTTAKVPKGTFSTIESKLENLEDKDFRSFFAWLYGELADIRAARDNQYRILRSRSSRWISWSPRILAFLGALGLLLTAFASAVTLMPPETSSFLAGSNKWALLVAMSLYAIMGAIALYERGTDKTSAYFRHLAVGIAIRNLWNKFQLTLLKEYPNLAASTDTAASRRRVCELAEAFCNDVDKLVGDEQTQWHTELVNSLNELDQIATKGAADVKAQVAEFAETAAKAAQEAKAAVERIEAATKPGHLNLAISGQFDGELIVLVDDVEKARANSKKIAIENIPAGVHKISIRAKKGASSRNVSEMLEVKPGIQSHSITLE